MRLEIYRQIPDDAQLRQEWNSLVERLDRPEVFYTWEWAKAMEMAYGTARQPWVAVATEGTGLVGIAALSTQADRIEFLSSTTADYCDFLSAPDHRRELVELVFAELRRAGCRDIVLTNLPQDSTTASVLTRIARNYGFRAFSRPAYECAQVRLGTAEERKQLLSTLTKKKWLRRNINKMTREAAVSLNHLRSWAEVEPVLSRFIRAHVGRFLSTQRISNLVRADRRLFLRDLARRLSESNWLCLTQLMWGDRLVAWNYGFQFAGNWFWYQPAIDSRFEEQSPGHVLLASIVIEACNNPEMGLVDLGLGAEDYKERITNGTRTTLHVTLSRSISRSVRESVRYRLAERAKRSPQMEARIRRSLAQLESARRRLRNDSPRKIAAWATQVATRSVLSSVEVRFYEWPDSIQESFRGEAFLTKMDLDALAQVAMDHEDDPGTAAYLMRSAQRLKSGSAEGYLLADEMGTFVHLCWAGDFEGFEMSELQTRLSAPTPAATLIFDCWTPMASRGRSHYAKAITMLAEELRARERSPWIFAAAPNTASVRGIENAGFVYRYSMISRKTPAGRTLTTVPAPATSETPVQP
jgi:CelD/BcsL family acetyltransferase involved in cellulose biosynthesis